MSEAILYAEPPSSDARENYGADPSQFLELFLPGQVSRSSLPVLFFIHGGFWKSQYDCSHAAHLCNALAENLRIAVVNCEYRRVGSTGGGWPSTFQDVARAADLIPSLGDKYSLDLRRAIAMGHSAGGQLALWLGMRSAIKNGSLATQNGHMPFHFATLISLAGVVDLKKAYYLGLGGGAVKDLIGGSPETLPERYAATSPIELLPDLRSSTAQFILIHGSDDTTVPVSLSRDFAERSDTLQIKTSFTQLEKTGHFELIDPKTKQFLVVQNQVREAIVD